MKKCMKFAILSLASLALVGCGNNDSDQMKVGLLALHDSNSTYDKNFIDAFKAACEKENVKAVIKTGVPESTVCYDKALECVEDGCKFVFADSFGHEDHVLKAAKENPDVEFSHATGTKAHTENQANYHNAFASIYEGRYLAGVAAGLKLQDMGETAPKIGYIGAYTYAEVISGYTSFFLGVRSVVPGTTMDVRFTGSWYDEAAEKEAAKTLIDNGCKLISQHADSWGAPSQCEASKIPNVSYNGSTESRCPDTYIISSKVNWEPYFRYAISQVKAGKTIDTDWTGELGETLYDASVALTEIGKKAAAANTETVLKEKATALKNGSLKVFDCSKFTVKNTLKDNASRMKADAEGHLTSYTADVNTDAAYTPDTEAVETVGDVTFFAESSKRSAPYFDIQIDGITLLNTKF